jgi:hypothetical protein
MSYQFLEKQPNNHADSIRYNQRHLDMTLGPNNKSANNLADSIHLDSILMGLSKDRLPTQNIYNNQVPEMAPILHSKYRTGENQERNQKHIRMVLFNPKMIQKR